MFRPINVFDSWRRAQSYASNCDTLSVIVLLQLDSKLYPTCLSANFIAVCAEHA